MGAAFGIQKCWGDFVVRQPKWNLREIKKKKKKNFNVISMIR
jgi:hypothetical protein